MFSKSVLGAAAVIAALSAAPVAFGDPDTGADVPRMDHDAVLGQPCSSWERYIFGRGPDGQTLACITSGGASGVWVASMPLVGVAELGTPCEPSRAAQSPDGRGLICTGSGWLPGP